MLPQQCLFLRSRVGITQQPVFQLYFADIVQCCRQRNAAAHRARKPVLSVFLCQLCQQQRGNDLNTPHMIPALAVTLFHYPVQQRKHDPAVLIRFLDLFFHRCAKPPLLRVQPHGIADALAHYPGIKGASDVIRRAQIKGAAHGIHLVLTRDHDDRDIFQHFLPVHFLQHRKAIHSLHVDVQQHDGNPIAVFLQQVQALFSTGGLGGIKAAAQYLGEHSAVHGRIVHDQHALSAFLPVVCVQLFQHSVAFICHFLTSCGRSSAAKLLFQPDYTPPFSAPSTEAR